MILESSPNGSIFIAYHSSLSDSILDIQAIAHCFSGSLFSNSPVYSHSIQFNLQSLLWWGTLVFQISFVEVTAIQISSNNSLAMDCSSDSQASTFHHGINRLPDLVSYTISILSSFLNIHNVTSQYPSLVVSKSFSSAFSFQLLAFSFNFTVTAGSCLSIYHSAISEFDNAVPSAREYHNTLNHL